MTTYSVVLVDGELKVDSSIRGVDDAELLPRGSLS